MNCLDCFYDKDGCPFDRCFEGSNWKPKAPLIQPEDAGLMPCPFCGGETKLSARPLKPQGYCVCCQDCDIGLTVWLAREQAIEAWNTRTPSPSHLKEIAELLPCGQNINFTCDIKGKSCDTCNGLTYSELEAEVEAAKELLGSGISNKVQLFEDSYDRWLVDVKNFLNQQFKIDKG